MSSKSNTQQTTVLVVDDEASVRQIINFALRRADYAVLEASSAAEAREILFEQSPDIILLDWMMNGVSGIELARSLRRDLKTEHTPIIMLTAKSDETDKISGLDVVDDYMTKPFSPRELIARIQAVLRRSANSNQMDESVRQGQLELDVASHRVTATIALPEGGESAEEVLLDLGPTEFRLLQFFMNNPDRVYARGQLLDQVWGQNVYVEERTVDVHIRRLRKALEPGHCQDYVQTVRGVGYRFSVA